VKEEKLKDVVNGDMWRVNNFLDDKHIPRDADVIVKDARSQVGDKPYNLMKNNCEHFAKELRYGISISEQVSHRGV